MQILIHKRTVPFGNKAVKQQKLQSSRWNKTATQSPLSTAPQGNSIEPQRESPPQDSCTTDVETTTFISKEDHRRVDRSHSFHNEQPREEKPKSRNRAKSSHFRRQYDAGLKNYPKQADGASRQTNVSKPAKIFKHPEYSRRATANLQGQRPRNTQEPRMKQLPQKHRWQLSK